MFSFVIIVANSEKVKKIANQLKSCQIAFSVWGSNR
jgi:hypothetical protein